MAAATCLGAWGAGSGCVMLGSGVASTTSSGGARLSGPRLTSAAADDRSLRSLPHCVRRAAEHRVGSPGNEALGGRSWVAWAVVRFGVAGARSSPRMPQSRRSVMTATSSISTPSAKILISACLCSCRSQNLPVCKAASVRALYSFRRKPPLRFCAYRLCGRTRYILCTAKKHCVCEREVAQFHPNARLAFLEDDWGRVKRGWLNMGTPSG